MSFNYNILLGFIAIICLEAYALYLVKLYSLNEYSHLYIILSSMLCYCAIIAILAYILRQGQPLSTFNITWNILSTIYGIIIGVLLFNEHITNSQYYGICLGLLALLLISYKDEQ